MTSASVDRPHRDSGMPPRIAMRPSRFLLGVLLAFIAVASGAVFECVRGYFGFFDAGVATLICLAALGVATARWTRRQPIEIGLHADGLTLWDHAGTSRYRRIVGCAQWSNRLLALTLSAEREKPETLLISTDSVDADTFRQLAVSARRAANAYL